MTEVFAPMDGKILQVKARVGQSIQEDETIAVMEAMKMEIQIVAPVTGTLVEIRVEPGQPVDPDTVIAVIQ
jgi:biotin carboxyl carrier protein